MLSEENSDKLSFLKLKVLANNKFLCLASYIMENMTGRIIFHYIYGVFAYSVKQVTLLKSPSKNFRGLYICFSMSLL